MQSCDFRVDALELRVAVGVLRAFDRLIRGLKAVAVLAKQLAHRPVVSGGSFKSRRVHALHSQ